MPFRAMTSERCCGSHPWVRSPSTALHQAGFGIALHDWIGDCAMASDELAMITANRIRQIELNVILCSCLDVMPDFFQQVSERMNTGSNVVSSDWVTLDRLGAR